MSVRDEVTPDTRCPPQSACTVCTEASGTRSGASGKVMSRPGSGRGQRPRCGRRESCRAPGKPTTTAAQAAAHRSARASGGQQTTIALWCSDGLRRRRGVAATRGAPPKAAIEMGRKRADAGAAAGLVRQRALHVISKARAGRHRLRWQRRASARRCRATGDQQRQPRGALARLQPLQAVVGAALRAPARQQQDERLSTVGAARCPRAAVVDEAWTMKRSTVIKMHSRTRTRGQIDLMEIDLKEAETTGGSRAPPKRSWPPARRAHDPQLPPSRGGVAA